MVGGAAAAADGNGNGIGKDGGSINPTPTRLPLSMKLLWPLLLVAVLATVFLGVFALLLGGSAYSVLPRFFLPDALSAPSSSRQRAQQPCAGDGKAPLQRWTRAPASPSAWHNMTEEELLWAASWRPAIGKYPYRRVPKVAFLFLTAGPLHLAPLWEKFFAGAGSRTELYSIYVHATPGYSGPKKFPRSSPFHRRHVPSKVVQWGEPTMFDAERRLLANALLDPANDRFVLVSESCIPLFNFTVVYDYLTGSSHSFVNAFDDPGPGGLGRYNGALAPEVTPEQWRKGSQWFELARDLAVTVVADERYYPKFREHCRPGCYVDEHYLPTVLTAVAPARIANRSVTWTDWSRGGAHPATFGEGDIDEAFLTRLTTEVDQKTCEYNGQPSQVCFLFARKFAPNTLKPLLKLAPKFLGYG
ncbi:unnamed protein product [Urochloa decumbens]|uniref:Uncharacterized protein n=1 Tax=Urochloa decumbens TaxID=240449 RepID=A0ABC8VVH7_9POAL